MAGLAPQCRRGKLIYSAIASLDGFVNDERGEFEWAAPDAEVFACVNDLERQVGTYLYGRRMYETMAVWQTMALDARHRRCATSPRSGAQRTRSCTP